MPAAGVDHRAGVRLFLLGAEQPRHYGFSAGHECGRGTVTIAAGKTVV